MRWRNSSAIHLARALRVDKLTYAALIATLEHYRRDEALEQIPVWRMISRSLDDIRTTAERWAAQVPRARSSVANRPLAAAVCRARRFPLRCSPSSANRPDRALEKDCARADPPVIARIAENRVLLDPRTVLPEQEARPADGAPESVI